MYIYTYICTHTHTYTHTTHTHTHTHTKLTPCSTVLPEKLTGPQLVKKFP